MPRLVLERIDDYATTHSMSRSGFFSGGGGTISNAPIKKKYRETVPAIAPFRSIRVRSDPKLLERGNAHRNMCTLSRLLMVRAGESARLVNNKMFTADKRALYVIHSSYGIRGNRLPQIKREWRIL